MTPPPDRSLDFLEWPALLEALAGHARSTRGAAACRILGLAADAGEASERMAEVTEATALVRAGAALPGLAFPDVEPCLVAAEKGLLLGPEELRSVADLCEVAESARRFFAARGEAVDGLPAAPRLAEIAGGIEAAPEIADRVRGAIDPSGAIRDAASPELGRLRHERDGLAAGVRERIEKLMDAEELAPHLQDRFFTVRGDRYVLPLKASSKSMGLGIVHDTSRTGETVFVEPTAVVDLNNRLKVAERGIEHEIKRILEELSQAVAEAAPGLAASLDVLARLDVIAAAARLSIAYDGHPVSLEEASVIALGQVRHPLLALGEGGDGRRTVANDLSMGAAAPGEAGGPRVLVVSGPNAGGKTVLLKTAGLAALLARAGLHVPAAAGGRIGLFDPVLAEIGDQQSLAGGLSTFSAHLSGVGAILRAAVAPGARPLVLVDELMAGTNPEQGGALARSTLEALAETRGLVIATTHHDSLKALAESDARFRNAGMEYDLERLTPTFRLKVGTPGRSYALDIAARMGLPEAVIARARALAGAATVGLEDVVANLEAREAALARETEALARERALLAEVTGDSRAAVDALERREKELGQRSRQAVDEAVREAREAIRAIIREAQRAGSPRAAEAARRTVEETARAAKAAFPAASPPPAASKPPLVVGAAVHVASLGKDGVVARIPDARGRVKVTVGAMAVDVEASDLGPPTGSAAPPRAARRAAEAQRRQHTPSDDDRGAGLPDPRAATDAYLPTSVNTLDLRGKRADEALGEVEAYLDRAAMENRSPLFIIHGHGTGALKKIVRDYLAGSPYVRRWSPGGRRQGGDGVSVVEI